eukprot:Rmarinus@m.15552
MPRIHPQPDPATPLPEEGEPQSLDAASVSDVGPGEETGRGVESGLVASNGAGSDGNSPTGGDSSDEPRSRQHGVELLDPEGEASPQSQPAARRSIFGIDGVQPSYRDDHTLYFEPAVDGSNALIYGTHDQLEVDITDDGIVTFRRNMFVSLPAKIVHVFTLLVFIFSAVVWWGFLANVMVECLMLTAYASKGTLQAGAIFCALTGLHFAAFPLFISVAVVGDVMLKFESLFCYVETLLEYYEHSNIGHLLQKYDWKPGFRSTLQGITSIMIVILPLFIAGVMLSMNHAYADVITVATYFQFYTVFIVMNVYIIAFMWVNACVGGLEAEGDVKKSKGDYGDPLYVDRGVSIVDAALPRHAQAIHTKCGKKEAGMCWRLWIRTFRGGLWLGLVFVLIAGVVTLDISGVFKAIVIVLGAIIVSVWMVGIARKDESAVISLRFPGVPKKYQKEIQWYMLRAPFGVCLFFSGILFISGGLASFGISLLFISLIYIAAFLFGVAEHTEISHPVLNKIRGFRHDARRYPMYSRIYHRDKWIWTTARWLGIGLMFIFLILVLFVLGFPETVNDSTLEVTPGDATQYWSSTHATDYTQHPVCDYVVEGYTATDYALFSKLAYHREADVVQEAVDGWFGADNVTLVHTSDYGGSLTPKFHDFVHNATGVRVITVRGSVTADDFFHDFDLWFESCMIMLLRAVYPFAEALDFFYPKLIEVMSFIELRIKDQDNEGIPVYYYVDYVREYVQAILDADPNASVVITGHSLGGGVASIVGADLHIPAVVFCAPGIYLSRDKFGLDKDDVNDYTTNVWHGSDLVPAADLHGRNLFHLECNDFIFSCHFMLGVVCDMRELCDYKSDVVLIDTDEYC